MGKIRREDLEMKIPALLHLSRLGYGYLSREQLRGRDRTMNLLPETLKAAVERINGVRIPAEMFGQLTDDLRIRLDAEDLGRHFYRTIRDGWNGLRLIDFAHPNNNLFQCAAELACGSGAGSFRPDITLFVNGLPLAMIEVKSGKRAGGFRTEFNRMLERSSGRDSRRYLQCAQVWAFSDDRSEDPDRLLPTEGTFYATVVPEDFPVYTARGRQSGSRPRLLRRNTEEEKRILEESGIRELPHTRAFLRHLSPDKPAHRMISALFYPERFLFLLRYGIQYVQETDPAGKAVLLTRRMLTAGQISALRALTGKARRGFRNWTVPACGAAGEQAFHAALAALLRDLKPGAGLYWVSADDAQLRQDRVALEACGIPCILGEAAKENQLILIPADQDLPNQLWEADAREVAGGRVYILPQPVVRYGQNGSFAAGLRRADPEAILVTRRTDLFPEGGFSAILLRMEVKGGAPD